MGFSEAGQFLQQALLSLSSNPSQSQQQLRLEPDDVFAYVSYCENVPPSDAKEFLMNIVGDQCANDIVTGYLSRREGTGPHISVSDSQGEVMQAYLKPPVDEYLLAGTKKTPRNSKIRSGTLETKVSSNTSNTSRNGAIFGLGPKGKGGVIRSKKEGKGMSLAEAVESMVLISRGAPCDCQASRHKLINNCLSCGKIVCEQEGEGPCTFCGALVLREGSDYAGLEGSALPSSDAEAAAQAFKDRLVEYDRTSSQRTTVIDDQSDYFQIDGDAWLSEQEKQLLQKRQDELEQAEEARKKKLVVSIDLVGRKVLMDGESETDLERETSILGGVMFGGRQKDVRIKPNPCISVAPVFTDSSQTKDSANSRFETIAYSRTGGRFARSGRVQHDNYLEALGPTKLKERQFKTMQGPDSQLCYEDEGCLAECSAAKLNSSLSSSLFDICEPRMNNYGKGKPVMLSPSTLAQKQTERMQLLTSNISSGTEVASRVLMQGVVLLKYFLNPSDQVAIVRQCRSLGIGPGGFYVPGYGNENKMHLWMMCLGKNWEPTTRSYELKRSYDNATAPDVPLSFINIVNRALHVAQQAVRERESIPNKDSLQLLPAMRPEICIVNFYEHSGRLGMHQDRDESRESIQKGTPVVSFSIGDSAEFLYGMDRNVEMAQRINLDSGDVLIFGGPSRLMFHGVPHIFPKTAPSWLIDESNIRSGRLNLTFRQL